MRKEVQRLVLCVVFAAANCEVLVVDRTGRDTLATYRSVTASFGKPLPEDGLRGVLVVAE